MIYWRAIRQLSIRGRSRRCVTLRLGAANPSATNPYAKNPYAKNPHAAGFTYVELMIVLTIICVLAAIAIPNFLEAKTRAAIARSKSELTTIKMAVEGYRSDHRAYPPNRIANTPDGADLLVLTTPMAYLTQLPKDIMTTREGRSSSSNLPVRPAYYSYLNALQVSPEEGLRFYYPPLEVFDRVGSIEASSEKRDWLDTVRERGMPPVMPNAQTGRKPPAPLSAGSASTSETMFGGFVAGMIWGKGPGQTIPKDPCKDATLILSDGLAFGIAYDPTNGTVSRGDIYMRLP
ncbi:MAG: type II secretion system protein [Candidatus Sumerlaeota bacterium]|nr:type II secretion system protein [Candidatus Sumerlaeota bacterium]